MPPRAPKVIDADLPESDRAGEMPHPRQQVQLYGHGQAVHQLVSAAHTGAMHHAWLITGPRGVGKATLAWRFVRAVLASGLSACPADLHVPADDRAFRLVAGMAHPDVMVLRRPWDTDRKKFKSELPVDEVRRLRGFFAKHPSLGDVQLAVIDCMDDMNLQAQNALLKILEEPPKAAILLLVAHTPGLLLPTIRSRCRTLQLRALAPADMRAAIQGLAPQAPADQLELAMTLAEGAPGQAAVLAASGLTGAYRQILSVLATLPRLNHAMLHGLSEQFMKQFADQGIEGFSRLLSLAMQRHVRAGMGTASAHPAERETFERMNQALAPARWAQLCADLHASEQRASALNQDKKQFVLNAFFSLESAIRV